MSHVPGAMLGQVPHIGQTPVPSEAADSTTIVPVNKNIFVKPNKPPEKVGAMFVPPSSSVACTATVIASDSALCKPGDTVVFSRFWPFTYKDQTLVTCNEKDLVGVEPAAPAAAVAKS